MMRTCTRTSLLALVAVAAYWLAGEASLAAGKQKAEFGDIGVGRIVSADGRPMPGKAILAKDIKVRGNTSSEWKFIGEIDAIDGAKQTIGVAGLPGVRIRVPPAATILDLGPQDAQTGKTIGDGPPIDFARLKRGQRVRVKALGREEGSFEAFDIEVRKSKSPVTVEIEGPVQEIDTVNKTFKILGFTIQTNQQTSLVLD